MQVSVSGDSFSGGPQDYHRCLRVPLGMVADLGEPPFPQMPRGPRARHGAQDALWALSLARPAPSRWEAL